MIILSVLFLMLVITPAAYPQADIATLEVQLEESHGAERLVLLNELTEQLLDSNSRKALRYGKQAVALADNLFPPEDSLNEQYYLKVDAYNALGVVRFARERYYDARVSFNYARKDADRIGYQEGKTRADFYLSMLDTIATKSGIVRQTFGDLRLGQSIREGSQDIGLNATLRAAESNENNGNYFKAIRNYEKAIDYLRDQGEEERITEMYRKIAENYERAGNMTRSLEYYNLAVNEKEKLGDTTSLKASKDSIAKLQVQIGKFIDANTDTVAEARKKKEVLTRDEYKQLAAASEAEQDYEKSLEYYKLYTQLNEKIIEDEKAQELAMLEKSHEIERNLQEIQLLTQEKEIQELEILQKESELEQQTKFRKNLIVGIALLAALLLTLYLLYVQKRRDHKRLNKAHQDLQLTQDKLIRAEKHIKTLLDQQLSTEVARELMSDSAGSNIRRKLVCIMFLDIRGFTQYAESRKPEEIIRYQNEVFGFMIDVVYKHKGVINQFLGDGFMATFGAPESSGNDSEHAFLAAREIVKMVNRKSDAGEIPETRIGIGLHTGKVVVGNVGTNLRKQYSITGNAVIIAARIEQLNKTYGSQLLVSEEVIRRIDHKNGTFESLGAVQLKGREKPVELYRVL